MEKGNLRNTQSSSKTNSSDGKGKQDGRYTRYQRYKDGASPRPDTGRKPNPQRNREVFDKRPRTRSSAVYEKYRNEVVEGSLGTGHHQKQGSKKVNLNHLLNFSLAPHERTRDIGRPVRNKTKLPKYNKELFLQANCQFVIHDSGNYTPYSSNADLLVDWSLIEEIRLPSHEIPSCPICLYAPHAAKITRCGHIYCWACILHYLSLTDRSWQKCPICFDAIHLYDLKSVVCLVRNFVSVGSKITMCLMKRAKGSLFPLPALEHKTLTSVCNIKDDEKVTRYQKLLLASKTDIHAIIEREREQLQVQLALDEGQAEVCFIESALRLLQERENMLDQKVLKSAVEADDCSGNTENVNVPCIEGLKIEDKRLSQSSCESDDYFQNDKEITHSYSETGIKMKEYTPDTITTSFSAGDVRIADDGNIGHEKEKDSSFFYFYQAEDGQHIYLHGLNVRMLVWEFGCLKDSPPVIEAKVIALEKISMTEEIRKRLKYLQHIPLTCEFQVAELQLNPILSKPTVQEFADEVAKRQKMRTRKAREERKREKMIEIEEKKKMGMYPSPTYNLKSCHQFPVCVGTQENPKTELLDISSPSNAAAAIVDGEDYEVQYPTFESHGTSPENNETSRPVASFAQMLRDAKTGQPWRGIVKSKTVPVSKSNRIDTNEDSDYDDATVPEYQESFSNAIQVALENALMQEQGTNGTEQVSSRKKKKSKNKVLFSTSMCRSK